MYTDFICQILKVVTFKISFSFYVTEPDKPSIDILESGYDFVNVSWLPSGAGPPKDPGCDFIVEYKLDGWSNYIFDFMK